VWTHLLPRYVTGCIVRQNEPPIQAPDGAEVSILNQMLQSPLDALGGTLELRGKRYVSGHKGSAVQLRITLNAVETLGPVIE